MSFEVGVVAQFTATHHLVGDFGGARLPHSHAYRVEVGVSGDSLHGDGTLFDITRLQNALAEVIAELDGSDLNDLCATLDAPVAPEPPTPPPTLGRLVVPNPTAEVMARFVFDRVAPAVSGQGLSRLQTRIWESPEAYASYCGGLA